MGLSNVNQGLDWATTDGRGWPGCLAITDSSYGKGYLGMTGIVYTNRGLKPGM